MHFSPGYARNLFINENENAWIMNNKEDILVNF